MRSESVLLKPVEQFLQILEVHHDLAVALRSCEIDWQFALRSCDTDIRASHAKHLDEIELAIFLALKTRARVCELRVA